VDGAAELARAEGQHDGAGEVGRELAVDVGPPRPALRHVQLDARERRVADVRPRRHCDASPWMIAVLRAISCETGSVLTCATAPSGADSARRGRLYSRNSTT